jgi:hypothetical protein
MGLPRPPGSPITLQETGRSHTLPAGHGNASVGRPGEVVRTHYFAPYGHVRPAKTQGCIAVSA